MNQFNLNDLFTPNHRTEKYALTGFGTNGIVYGKPVNAADGAIVPFHQSEIIPWASRPKAAKGARLCPRGTEIQTLIFSKDNFTQDQAKDWAWEHDFNAGVDEKENTYRLRQQHPSKFKDGTFRTIDITDGIKAVIGCPIAKAGTGAQVTKEDIVENARFKNKNGDIFIVDKVYPNETFGTAVESSIEGGKKGNYRDSLEDFVAFMNEEGATKMAGSGAYWIAIQPTKIASRGTRLIDGHKFTFGKEDLYNSGRYNNVNDLVADVVDYFNAIEKDLDKKYADEMRQIAIKSIQQKKLASYGAKTATPHMHKNWEVKYLTFQGKAVKDVIRLGRMSDKFDVQQALKRRSDTNIREVLYIKEVASHGGQIDTSKLTKDILIEAANNDNFNEAVATVQKAIGQDDGFVASIYFSGAAKDVEDKWKSMFAEQRIKILSNYAKFEDIQSKIAARGAKTPQAMGKDRKYTSDQPHEKRYKLKRKSRVLRYKKS